MFTQGSSFLATLGFTPESRWDSPLEFSKEIRTGLQMPPSPSITRSKFRFRISRFRFFALGLAALFFANCLSFGATESPIADAAEKSDCAAIRTLLKQHADVDAPQADGMTALHWAAYLDDLETAKALFDAKANANATNRYGVTPLSLACQSGNTAMVEFLLDQGADPNTALRGGETVLMTAARTGKAGPVKALLSRGAAVDAKERRGQTALMWAAADGHAAVVELLLKAGADFRTPLPDSGFTPLFFAARDGRAEVVRVLLKAGADVNETMQPRKPSGKGPRKGTSALILAVENGHFDLALALIEAGADPNDQRSGFTPLHAMTWVRKPNRGEDDGDPSPLGSGNLSSVQFIRKLVEHGADVNARLKNGKGGPGLYNKVGATPFLMAAATADAVYMRLLVELGANPLLENVDNCTPLMVACGIGVGSAAANEVAGEEPEVLEAAQLALDLGVDVNAVDANGETAMHGAAYKNLPKVVQFLAGKGAKAEIWNQKNKYGWTPLLIAEGHRPGNFKPSAETIAALHHVMLAAGVSPTTNAPPVAPSGPDYQSPTVKKQAQ
jgi:ankyrin repeat protein